MTEFAVITTDKPGISTTLVGEQVIQGLTALGHKVVPVYTDGREGTPINVSPLSRLPTICLLEHKIPAILAQTRFSRPRCLVSVWTGNVEGYSVPAMLHYLAYFIKPKVGGVPLRHVSHSYHTAEKITELTQTFLRPNVGMEIARHTEVNLYGVDPVFQPGENDPDVLVAPMNRVSQGAKNVSLHAEITRNYQLLAKLRGFKPQTTFYYAPGFGPEDKSISADLSAYDFQQQPADRADYVKNAARTGMFFCCSKWESFGIYYLELLLSGAVGVFLDYPWVRQLLPDYPFIVSKKEAIPALLHVRENYAAVRATLIATVLPKLRETYSLDRFCRGLVKTADSLMEKGED